MPLRNEKVLSSVPSFVNLGPQTIRASCTTNSPASELRPDRAPSSLRPSTAPYRHHHRHCATTSIERYCATMPVEPRVPVLYAFYKPSRANYVTRRKRRPSVRFPAAYSPTFLTIHYNCPGECTSPLNRVCSFC